MMVGSTVITRKAGEHVKRAEELGYFKFGKSLAVLYPYALVRLRSWANFSKVEAPFCCSLNQAL